MGFFTGEVKRLAKKSSQVQLANGYQRSDLELIKASYKGDPKELNKAMKEHRKYEYALLYRNTPEFQRKQKKR